MHCGYLHCHSTIVSCTHLSNCSTCIDGSFLTYATLPVVKASRVIIANQYTLVWSASINVLYMLQFFAFTYTLHYIAHIYLTEISHLFLDLYTMKSCKTVPINCNTPDCFSFHLSACSNWWIAECTWNLILECTHIATICWPFYNLLNSLEWELFWMKVYLRYTFSLILSVFKTIEQKQANPPDVYCV
jgi:hypothetical protein